MQEELNQFCRNKVWTLVPFPYEKIAISSKWVFKNKKDELGTIIKNKARLDDKGISICQEKYTKDLLNKYDIYDSSSVKKPMVSPNNLGPDLAGKPVNETLYRGMIGSLIYLTVPERYSIVVTWYPKCLGFYLKGYSDSDYVGYNMDRKSTSCACQLLEGKLVFWSVKKQQSVAMSSAEDNYVAAVGCCVNILWMKSQLSDYDIYYNMVPIFYENTSAIVISNNPLLHSRIKHIGLETSGALPQKRKKSKTQTTSLVQTTTTPPKEKVPTKDYDKTQSVSSGQSTHPQDTEGNTQHAINGFHLPLKEGTRSSKHLPEGKPTDSKDQGKHDADVVNAEVLQLS
nr:uncharacterized mitochondrial protein AtMg00810-like [Tanacetum cinerariifolium]